MKPKYIILLLSISTILILSCTSNENFINITLEENQRLEDSPHAWFIKAMRLSYDNPKPLSITRRMQNYLDKHGERINRFKEKNQPLHIMWSYYSMGRVKDYIKHDFVNKIFDYYYRVGYEDDIIIEGVYYEDTINFIYRYPPPGISWETIIPLEYKRLNTDLETIVFINSKK